MDEKKKLLEVEHLRKYFTVKSGMLKKDYIHAVEDVSFTIYEGETLGIVGESGCGKSTLGRSILRLYEPTSGKVTFDGEVIFDGEQKKQVKMLPYRKKMQIIFQDPFSSLSPRMPVGEIIGEAVREHNIVPKAEYNDYIDTMSKIETNNKPRTVKRKGNRQ